MLDTQFLIPSKVAQRPEIGAEGSAFRLLGDAGARLARLEGEQLDGVVLFCCRQGAHELVVSSRWRQVGIGNYRILTCEGDGLPCQRLIGNFHEIGRSSLGHAAAHLVGIYLARLVACELIHLQGDRLTVRRDGCSREGQHQGGIAAQFLCGKGAHIGGFPGEKRQRCHKAVAVGQFQFLSRGPILVVSDNVFLRDARWQRIGFAQDIEAVGIGIRRDLGDALFTNLYAEGLLGYCIFCGGDG